MELLLFGRKILHCDFCRSSLSIQFWEWRGVFSTGLLQRHEKTPHCDFCRFVVLDSISDSEQSSVERYFNPTSGREFKSHLFAARRGVAQFGRAEVSKASLRFLSV